jgi:hypothetical protein
MEQPDVRRRGIPVGVDMVGVNACRGGQRFCASPVYPYLLTDDQPLRLVNGELNGRPLEFWLRWDPEGWRNLMAAYNVGWMLCWSEACKAAGSNKADHFSGSWDFGPYRLLALPNPPGFFLSGKGQLQDSPGRIGATEVTPESGRVVLRFHWVKGMDVVPEGIVRGYAVEGSPNDIIEVREPPAKFWINH